LFSTLSPGRRLALGAGALVAVLTLLVLGSAAVIHMSERGNPASASQPSGSSPVAAASAAAPGGLTETLSPAQSAGVASDIALLTATPAVTPATSARYPAISGVATSQPDLYARAFASQLLTHDYRTPRKELLAWVQYESAQCAEPRVVGLVPSDLRSKLAVYSVTMAADGSAVPIPSQRDWDQWAARHAYTTVTIQKVTEPLKWSEAVSSGQLTDPGATAREVDAEVVTHWTERGKPRRATHSVALNMSLEGPPSHDGYGFVTSVIYNSVAVS
jgi:hypothetical protein